MPISLRVQNIVLSIVINNDCLAQDLELSKVQKKFSGRLLTLGKTMMKICQSGKLSLSH